MLSRLHPNISLMVVALVAIVITAMLAAHQNPSEQAAVDETKTYSSAQDFEVYRYMSQFDQDYPQTHFEWPTSFNGVVEPISWARFAILAADTEIRSDEGLAPGDNQGDIYLYLYNPQNFDHFKTDHSCDYVVTDYQTFVAQMLHRHSFDDFQNLSRQVNAGRLAYDFRDRLLEAGFSRQIEIVSPAISCAILAP